jgi:dipeptide/tripeptide permease
MQHHFHLIIGLIVDIICFLVSIFAPHIAPLLLISAAYVPSFQIAAACAGIGMFIYTVGMDQWRRYKKKNNGKVRPKKPTWANLKFYQLVKWADNLDKLSKLFHLLGVAALFCSIMFGTCTHSIMSKTVDKLTHEKDSCSKRADIATKKADSCTVELINKKYGN